MKLLATEQCMALATVEPGGLTVSVVSNYEDFLSLEEEWSALLQASCSNSVFLTHQWFRCWWGAFGRDGLLFVVCVRDKGRLVGVAPLHLRKSTFRGLPIRKLAFPCNGYTTGADLIVAPPEKRVLRAIFAHLARCRERWDLLELKSVRTDSPFWTHLPDVAQAYDLAWLARPDKQVPFITVEGTWESYLSQRSRNFRKAFARRISHVEKHPEPVRVVRLNSPGELASALPGIFEVSKRSWKSERKRDIASDPPALRFFERLSDVLGQCGWVELWIALCGDKPVAFEYHLKYEHVTSPIRGDFDESFRNLSPGAYLESVIIQSLFDDPERPIVEYNTCADAYQYERRWTEELRSHDTAWIFAPSWYRAVLYPLALLRRPKSMIRRKNGMSCRPSGSEDTAWKPTGPQDASPHKTNARRK